jgi:hypothetical protein
MATCPECNKNSLEFSMVRKAAWCLYTDCAFSQPVKGHEEYILEFEHPAEVPRKQDENIKAAVIR